MTILAMSHTDQTTAPDGDDFAALSTLAALSGVPADQMPLLEIITNPANDPAESYTSRAEMYEDLAEMESYWDSDGFYDANTVADRVRAHVSRNLGGENFAIKPGDLAFGFECTSEGQIESFYVGVYLSYDLGKLVRSEEVKRVTDSRDATGIHAALGYASAILGDYQRMLAKAREHGLLPAS